MKKFLSLLLVIVMVASLCACGGEKQEEIAAAPAAPAASSETKAPESGEAAWPQSAISLVVPAGAGGGTDSNARLAAKYLTEELGVPVNVTNIKGASGVTGCTEVLNKPNDGYTLLFFDDNIVANTALGAWDNTWEDFEMCGNLLNYRFYLPSSTEFASLEEMKQAAAAEPGSVMFAGESAAFISILPLLMEKQMDISLQIVDGGQMAERLPLMVSNQVHMTFAPMSQIDDFVDSGDLNVLCVFSEDRTEAYPDIPTAKECGLDVVYERFQGVLAPKGTDPAICERISQALKAVSENPEFQTGAAELSLEVMYADPAGQAELFANSTKNMDAYIASIS